MNLVQVKKLMERKKTSHKGENGRVLIIGGSEEYTGAIALAGIAALRTGCDSVTIASPEKVAWALNTLNADLITHKVKITHFTIKESKDMARLAERYDAVLIGNGLTEKADKFVQQFLKKSQAIKVVDAEVLKSLSFKEFSNSIITPREGELYSLLKNSDKEFLLDKLEKSNAKEKAQVLQGNLRYFLQNNNVLLVKGSTDIIISRNKIAYNRTGNQGMTKIGTGDILAGLAVGFLAKTKDLFKSAVAAAYINGFVGDELLKKKKGYSFIATDILDDLEKIEKAINKNHKKEIIEKVIKNKIVSKPIKKEIIEKVIKNKIVAKPVKKKVIKKKVVAKPVKKKIIKKKVVAKPVKKKVIKKVAKKKVVSKKKR